MLTTTATGTYRPRHSCHAPTTSPFPHDWPLDLNMPGRYITHLTSTIDGDHP